MSEVVSISPSNLDSSLWVISPAFYMMHSTCKLNKQGAYIQPWHTLFPVLNQSVVPCPVLTVAFWPAYRFLRRQVRYSHLFKNFPVCCDPNSQGFSIVNKADFFGIRFLFLRSSRSWQVVLVPLPFLNWTCTSESSQFTYSWSLAWKILRITLQHVKWVLLYSDFNILWPSFLPFLCNDHWGRLSYLSLLFFRTLHSGCIFPFPLPFAFLLFSAICKASSDYHFVLLLHFFSWGWFWSLPLVQRHEPPSIVL